MLRIHREGKKPIFVALIILTILYLIFSWLISVEWLLQVLLILEVGLFAFIVHFFRNPIRHIKANPYQIIAPADGKVVVIEEVEETEYFKDKRIQVSIFMSPLNVHVNRYPNEGKISFAKYHAGKFLVAWHPKASTLNERTTVVVEGEKTGPILYRQIAGALARRIIIYAKAGMVVKQGADSGFIRFGSRVDIFLPLDAKINVKVGDKPVGGETVIASFKEV